MTGFETDSKKVHAMFKVAIAFVSLVSVAFGSAGQEVKFVQTDEFNGPFPSWRDVKRDYGAKGDGVADDSDAINRALADLKNEGREFSVLYFPAGVYRVTKTVDIVPQDPSRGERDRGRRRGSCDDGHQMGRRGQGNRLQLHGLVFEDIEADHRRVRAGLDCPALQRREVLHL